MIGLCDNIQNVYQVPSQAQTHQGGFPNMDGLIYTVNPNDLPADSVEQVEFSPKSANLFAAISWDCTLRLYEVSGGQIVLKTSLTLGAYPLSLAWGLNGNSVYVALSNNTIYETDFGSSGLQKFADCAATTFMLKSAEAINALISFDTTYNINVHVKGTNSPVITLNLMYPVIDASISGHLMLLALGDSHTTIIDLNSINLYKPASLLYIMSQLDSTLSTCSIDAETLSYVLGSVDGRIQKGAVKTLPNPQMPSAIKSYGIYFNTNDTQVSFIYIAHAKKLENSILQDMYQINSCGFNNRSTCFVYTAGSEGNLVLWDVKAKNKIGVFSLGNPITTCTINTEGTCIAFATGYDWSKGVWGLRDVNYKPLIGVKLIGNHELVYVSDTSSRL